MMIRVTTELESHLVRESLRILLMLKENDVYRLRCTTVVYF